MPRTKHQTLETSHLVIHLDELAQVLGKTPEHLKRNWRRMVEKLGMPRKHDGGDFWPRKSIEIWLARPSVDCQPSNDNTGDIPETVHATRVADQKAALKQLLEAGR